MDTNRKMSGLNAPIVNIPRIAGIVWSAIELGMKEKRSSNAITAIFLLAWKITWALIPTASIVSNQNVLDLNALTANTRHLVGTAWSVIELDMNRERSLNAITATFLLAWNVTWNFIQAAFIVTYQQHLQRQVVLIKYSWTSWIYLNFSQNFRLGTTRSGWKRSWNALIASILHLTGVAWSAIELDMKERRSLNVRSVVFLLAWKVM